MNMHLQNFAAVNTDVYTAIVVSVIMFAMGLVVGFAETIQVG